MRAASFNEGCFLPARMSDRCDSEHLISRANLTCELFLSIQILRGWRESMSEILADSEVLRQDHSSLSANGLWELPARPSGMPRKRKDPPPSKPRKLQLGAWLDRLGVRQIRVAEAVNVTPTYINELCSGAKTNPSNGILLDIAQFLGIPAESLYKLPPSGETAREVDGLSPAVLAKLREPEPE